MPAPQRLTIRRHGRLPGIVSCVLACTLAAFWWQRGEGFEQSEDAMAGGARHITLKTASKARVNLVCFRQDQCRMLVASNPLSEKNRRVAGKAQDNKALAACNGGYFVPANLMPSGLEIAQGVTTGGLNSSGPIGTLFGIKGDTPFIASEKDFQVTADLTGVVQCSPLLIDQGWTYHDADASAVVTARTFVMTDGKDQWAIGIVDHISLSDLAALLARPGLIEGFHVRRAMNLDGGPSTGFWWQDKNGAAHEPQRECWRVRNMVLVVPR